MEIFFWIVDLLIPVIMIFQGVLFINRPPRKINPIYGYRTRRSMLSQKTWDYANYRMAVLWLKWGIVLFVLIIISKLFMPIAQEDLSLIHAGIGLVTLFLAIPIVEKELKEKFDDKGFSKEKFLNEGAGDE